MSMLSIKVELYLYDFILDIYIGNWFANSSIKRKIIII